MKCMVCGREPRTSDVALERINRYGVKGVWTCHDHAAQALRMFAKAKGIGEVRPDLVKHVRGDDSR